MANQHPDSDWDMTSGSEADDSSVQDSGSEYADSSTDTSFKREYLQAQRDAAREPRTKEPKERVAQDPEPVFSSNRPRRSARKVAIDQSEGSDSTELSQLESSDSAPDFSKVCTYLRVLRCCSMYLHDL
jgi:hypothetical protein